MTAQIGMRPFETTEGNFLGRLQTGKFLDSNRVIMRLCVTLVLSFIIVLFCLFIRQDLVVQFWLYYTYYVRQT